VKIAEWEAVGPVSGLVEKQVAMLGAKEYASHVARDAETGRLRILVAADLGLLDYTYAPSAGADSPWTLHGRFNTWKSVKSLRLQSDAQLEEYSQEGRSVWRLLIEEPKAELSADSKGTDEHSEQALLEFAQACIQSAG
jgi:hypothetical protein